MAIQDIILRSSSHAPLTTKGSELTYGELDGNFIEIYDAVSSLNDVSGIEPFNIATTYTGTDYVSYNGNVYVHISPTSTTGVLPDADPTKWELTSTGALAHQTNKDSYLAYGSASQVSATDLADIINNQIINITFANFNTAKSNGTLKVNRLYCITNANSLIDTGGYVNSEFRLYIRTIANNQYSNKGFISFVAPKYDTFSVYDFTYPYVIGDIVGYGLFVYQCIADTTNGDTPNLATGDWTIKSYISFPAYYTIRYYDIEWLDIGGYISINKVYDNYNNIFGRQDFNNANIVNNNTTWNNDFDTLSYWNNVFGNVNDGVFDNKLIKSFFSSKGGAAPNGLSNNVLIKSSIFLSGFMNGDFYGNYLNNTQLNLDSDFIGSLTNLNISFANQTSLSVSDDTAIDNGYMNEQGSNITATIDITGTGGVVDLDSLLTYADIYGIFQMDCAGDMIDYLLKANYFCPIIIKPNTAHNYLTIKIYSLSGATNNQLVSTQYSSNIDLYTDNGDFAVLEKIIIDGVDLWNVTYINKIQ